MLGKTSSRGTVWQVLVGDGVGNAGAAVGAGVGTVGTLGLTGALGTSSIDIASDISTDIMLKYLLKKPSPNSQSNLS